MKKLMFIASAMFCGAALATGPLATPLTSGVVGYGQADLNLDYTGVGPMFFAIGEDVTSVQNLKVKGVSSAMGSGYTIAPITSTGNIPVNYYWWCGLSEYGVPDGWYVTDDGTTIEEAAAQGKAEDYLATINMAKGEGLVTYMMTGSLAVQGSGEVLSGDCTRPLNLDYTGVANPFPASVSIQDYAITGLTSAMGSGYTIAPITSTGNIPVNYYYWCGLSEYGVPDGWYITDDGATIEAAAGTSAINDLLADYTFTPGEAAVTYMMNSGLGLKITNPID